MQKKSTSWKKVVIRAGSVAVFCAVLLGTTFAWGTPSGSTVFNSINAGELTLDLVDASDVTLVGKTLGFVDGQSNVDDVIWAPGCTNTAQTFYLKNNGAVDVKYKISAIVISGSSGIADLIEWKVNGESINTFTAKLAAGESSGPLVVTGTMDKNAGNKFMNKTGDSVAIAVYAAEDNDEADFEEVVALIRDLDEMPAATIFNTSEQVTLDAAFTFSPVPGAPDEKYAQWNADYVISFDREIAPETVCLAGQYDDWSEDWLGFKNPVALEAGQELRLLKDSMGIYKTYAEICSDVQNFNCGVANLGVTQGTVMTVELRLYEVVNGAETGEYITAGTYYYAF
ncbi:MAG: hypothetical protein IJJ61_07845 [Clostridia bacterium]|nr:hypothetical protein [Clostridia bacterium]MBR6334894.1 hypothetical protein [Clostridia bacterium]